MSRGRHDGDGARGIVPGRHHDRPRDGTSPPTHAADPRRRSTGQAARRTTRRRGFLNGRRGGLLIDTGRQGFLTAKSPEN